MKKIWLLVGVCFLLFPVVLAVNRSQLVATVAPCDYLFVNVTASQPIDVDEYGLQGCYGNTTDNNWFCFCSDKQFLLTLESTPLTINNYTLLITYIYQNTESVVTYHSGGGGGGGRSCWFGYESVNNICVLMNITVTNITNGTIPVVSNVVPMQSSPTVQPPITLQPILPVVSTVNEDKVAVNEDKVVAVNITQTTQSYNTSENNATTSEVLSVTGVLKTTAIALGIALSLVVLVTFVLWILNRQRPPKKPVLSTKFNPKDDPRNPEFYENL